MKAKDEMINDLLEVIEAFAETVEEHIMVETDFSTIQPIVEQLREELVALSESE